LNKTTKKEIERLKQQSMREHCARLREAGVDPRHVQISQRVCYDNGVPFIATGSPELLNAIFGD
jgi:hypothetical protein